MGEAETDTYTKQRNTEMYSILVNLGVFMGSLRKTLQKREPLAEIEHLDFRSSAGRQRWGRNFWTVPAPEQRAGKSMVQSENHRNY